jgi:glycosyltransferase involved in cell wall biosynthesis
MAQGLPTLMCTPACNGQLGEDRNLVVYEAGSPASLAEVLKRLRALPAEEKRALGLRLRRLVKQGHSLENLAERIMALGLRGS